MPSSSSRHPACPVRRRPWLPALLALAVLAAPLAASAATAISLYLPSADGLTRDEAADVEAVIVSGLHQAARGGAITVRDPPLLRPTCGRSPSDACLGGLAGGGAVLVARARREGVHVAVSLALVNGQGRRTRWTSFLTTLTVQDARPCAQALLALEDELSRIAPGPRGAPPVAAAPRAEPPKGAVAAPAPGPRPAPPPPDRAPGPASPDRASGPASPDLAVRPRSAPLPPSPAAPPPSEPSGGWSTGRAAGFWIAAGGAALLAGGAAAGLHARSLDAGLRDRYAAGTLAPSDRPRYAEVRRWNGAANGLFIAGGALAAGGATLFLLSPAVEPVAGGGLSVGLAGRF